MKKLLLFISFFLISYWSLAQNLVPNGGFESFSDCPSAISQIYLATPWSNPTTGSPDYFNSCAPEGNSVSVPQNGFGTQHPKSGNAYSGFYAFNYSVSDGREYIQVNLSDSIVTNTSYIVSFWVSLADNYNYSIATLGAYISEEAISLNGHDNFEFQPQVINEPLGPLTDKENWVLIRDTFVSLGGEQFITIGNFSDDANSDTMYVGNGENNSLSSYYYIDDVSVVPLDSIVGVEEKKEIELSLYPNPNSGEMFVSYMGLGDKTEIIIHDIQGATVYQSNLKGVSGTEKLNLSELQAGMYLYMIIDHRKVYKKGKFVISE